VRLTLQEFMQQATAQLQNHSPSARLDAEVLAMHVCGLNRAQLVTRADTPLSAPQQLTLRALLARRISGVPLAYLTGEREFWSMALRVTDATLIPRPDTETLVEQALARIPQDAAWRIADLGTGSGAIALAIARERPRCHIVATDISAPALAVARGNAERLGLVNITFRAGSWHLPLQDERFDMVVSNPPYLRAGDAHLRAGDVQFEPRHALVAGDDGLDAIRTIAHHIKASLNSGGWLLLEHGYDQARAVGEILRAEGYGDIQCYQDLSGHDRVSLGRQRG
jgi:release factor glutamine methyltransferase